MDTAAVEHRGLSVYRETATAAACYAGGMKSKLPGCCPYLYYDDVDAAVAWLDKAFGFEAGFTSRGKDGKLEHAQVWLREAMVMLGRASGDVVSARKAPALHSGIYVYVDDVDAHCRRAREAGAKIAFEPWDAPWGERAYCAKDVEGQFWTFSNGPK